MRQFKCRDLIEHSDGRGSLGKVGQLTALVISSLGFLWMCYQDTMSEFYFVGYMLAWSGANVANKMADYKHPRHRYRDYDLPTEEDMSEYPSHSPRRADRSFDRRDDRVRD